MAHRATVSQHWLNFVNKRKGPYNSAYSLTTLAQLENKVTKKTSVAICNHFGFALNASKDIYISSFLLISNHHSV
jgi:hypothetical protein